MYRPPHSGHGRPLPRRTPGRSSAPSKLPPQARLGLPLALLWTLWITVLFDPQWLLASYGLTPLLKVRLLLFFALIGMLVTMVPMVSALNRRWQWYLPLLSFIGIGVITLPFAINNGMARAELTQYLLFYSLVVGTIVWIDSAHRAEKLMLMYCVAFIWWGLWGAREGMVRWHTVLSNYDGYGAFMVIGLGMCAFMTMAVPKGWQRYAMLAGSMLCLVGVVSSFARGAFLAAIGIFGVVFLRSPHKGRTLLAGLGGVVVLLLAASILHPGQFWAEVQSVFAQGTEEGTGEDRWVLWQAATKVFLHRPLFGVGPNNFGVYAAEVFEVGDVGGRYADNPGRLYDRSLHSLYFTTLSEEGIAGIAALIWMLTDFWKRNAALRRPSTQQLWNALGGRFKLAPVALSLEAGLVGFLVIAGVYSTAGKHWFWTILGMNLLLHTLVFGKIKKKAPPRPRVPVQLPVGASPP